MKKNLKNFLTHKLFLSILNKKGRAAEAAPPEERRDQFSSVMPSMRMEKLGAD